VTIKVITFDLDNTLWDVGPALRRAETAQNRWLHEHRPEALAALDGAAIGALRKQVWRDNAHLNHSVTAMRKLFLRAVQLKAGYSDAEAQAGAEAAFEAFLEERQRVELYDGVVDVLDSLARDYRIGALTNGNADVYKTAAGRFFDFAFHAEVVGASKPAPDLFHAALEHTGAAPHEVIHVGDSADHDIRGARAVGMRTFWLNPEGHAWEGPGRPDAQAPTVRELPALLARLRATA
jgi:putative hydrolase of the HAD superfamily